MDERQHKASVLLSVAQLVCSEEYELLESNFEMPIREVPASAWETPHEYRAMKHTGEAIITIRFRKKVTK